MQQEKRLKIKLNSYIASSVSDIYQISFDLLIYK